MTKGKAKSQAKPKAKGQPKAKAKTKAVKKTAAKSKAKAKAKSKAKAKAKSGGKTKVPKQDPVPEVEDEEDDLEEQGEEEEEEQDAEVEPAASDSGVVTRKRKPPIQAPAMLMPAKKAKEDTPAVPNTEVPADVVPPSPAPTTLDPLDDETVKYKAPATPSILAQPVPPIPDTQPPDDTQHSTVWCLACMSHFLLHYMFHILEFVFQINLFQLIHVMSVVFHKHLYGPRSCNTLQNALAYLDQHQRPGDEKKLDDSISVSTISSLAKNMIEDNYMI